MEITSIPFVKKLGLEQNLDRALQLTFNETVQNHLHTIHAGAIFTLAETASGEALQQIFPELVGKVVPVLRDAQVKYKKPATNTITAFSSVTEEDISQFRAFFGKKGRSLIAVSVEVRDPEGMVVCLGVFNWFIQRIE
jgi:acyl-coenzyme A thioesterase PaaI-like protein